MADELVELLSPPEGSPFPHMDLEGAPSNCTVGHERVKCLLGAGYSVIQTAALPLSSSVLLVRLRGLSEPNFPVLSNA